MLAPHDLVLHSAVHLFSEGETDHGLRNLLDLHRLLSPLARGALYLRGNWLRMPPLMLARHLFHKAFISPQPSTEEQI